MILKLDTQKTDIKLLIKQKWNFQILILKVQIAINLKDSCRIWLKLKLNGSNYVVIVIVYL